MEKLEQQVSIPDGFISGFKEQIPLWLGVIPFGLVYGAYAITQGIPAYVILAFSLLINAGSAQIAALGLLLVGANPFLIIFSIVLINMRFMLYSASLTMFMQAEKTPLKLLLSYWLTDATFLLILKKYQASNTSNNLRYAFGVGFGQWSAWELSCLVGVLLGPIIPSSLSLDFALPLIFITLIMGHLTNLPVLVSAIASAIMTVLLLNLPNNLGLFFSIVIGVGLGMWIEQRYKKWKLRAVK